MPARAATTDSTRLAVSVLAAAWLAVSAFAQADDRSREAVMARFAAGGKAMQAGQFAAAEMEYRAALAVLSDLAEVRANLGLVLFLQGKFAESVSELERVASERPELPAAHLFLGLGHLKLGSPAKAIPPLQRSLEDSPANLEARRALAACYLAQADYAGAVREFQAGFSYTPDKAEGWFRLGRDYMNLMSELAGSLVIGRPDSVWASRLGADMLGLSQAWEAAASYYEAALAKDPDLPGLHGSAGGAYLRVGDLSAAEQHFQAELRVAPRSERALLGLAELDLASGDAASALDRVARIWATNPLTLANGTDFPARPIPPDSALKLIGRLPRADGGPSRFLQAKLFEAAGHADRARLQLSLLARETEGAPARDAGSLAPAQLCQEHLFSPCARALESRPSLSRAELVLLGRAYLALGQDERATIAFTHAIKGSAGEAPEAVYWTVRTLQSLADQCFQEVKEVAPGSWRVHQLRAEAHRQRQADDQAISEYRRAIELKPDEPELHRSMGLIYLLDNSYGEAQQSLETALELDAANPRTLYVMGRLYVARQQHEESIRFLEGALRLDPNLVEARPSLGRAYLRAGRFGEAAVQLEKGLVLDYYGDIHYSLFQAHRRLGNAEEAKAALDRSVEMRKSSFARDRGKFDRWIKSE